MDSPIGLVLSDDLIFTSRITGTGRDLGLAMKSAKSVRDLENLARQAPPSCVIVDLANPGLKIEDLIAWLEANCTPAPRVVAYGSHVDVATLSKAREAGCDPVLPRSKFVEELPARLREWVAKPEA